MIDANSIKNRKLIVSYLKRDKTAQEHLADVARALKSKIQVSSDVVTGCGKATVRIRVKFR